MIISQEKETHDKRAIIDFFTVLSVCHTVVPGTLKLAAYTHFTLEIIEVDPDDPTNIKYQASSPDELALVEGAAAMGFRFFERTSHTIKIALFESEALEWEVLCEFPFDSTRKRMSLVVRPPHGKYCYLMTKGADSAMIPRLKAGSIVQRKLLEQHLIKFATEGLRTLVVGHKILKDHDVKSLLANIETVKVSHDKQKEILLNEIYDNFEQDLEYLGCSAIEDKLQDGVPETISTLMNADIRMWVLTGDKQETAVEIGKSCKLLQPGMELCNLTSETYEEFVKKLDEATLLYVCSTKLEESSYNMTLFNRKSNKKIKFLP